MTRAAWLVIVLALAGGQARADGLGYTFQETSDEPGAMPEKGRVRMVGRDGRLEWTETSTAIHDQGSIEIWRDGGKQHLVLDPKKKSYHDPSKSAAAKPRTATGESRVDPWNGAGAMEVFHVPSLMSPDVRIADVEVEVEELGEDAVAGKPCRHVAVTIRYTGTVTYGKEKLTANVKARAQYWMTDALGGAVLPFDHGKPALATGYAEVDAAIAPKLAAIPGVALRQIVNGWRAFEGSAPTTQSRSFEILTLEPATLTGSDLEPPAGFRYEEPRFSAATRVAP